MISSRSKAGLVPRILRMDQLQKIYLAEPTSFKEEILISLPWKGQSY